MARKIPLNELEVEIVKELKAYSDEVAEGIKKAVNDVAKETVRTLKTTSPRSMRGGKYARGWTFKVEFESQRISGCAYPTAQSRSSRICSKTGTRR